MHSDYSESPWRYFKRISLDYHAASMLADGIRTTTRKEHQAVVDEILADIREGGIPIQLPHEHKDPESLEAELGDEYGEANAS